MPQKITPKRMDSISNAISSILDASYYKRIGRFIGGTKRKIGYSPLAARPLDYKPGYQIVTASYENDLSKMIKESIASKLINKEVNKYINTTDGKQLKATVSDIIKDKLSERKKRI